jgi:hypothetical protein
MAVPNLSQMEESMRNISHFISRSGSDCAHGTPHTNGTSGVVQLASRAHGLTDHQSWTPLLPAGVASRGFDAATYLANLRIVITGSDNTTKNRLAYARIRNTLTNPTFVSYVDAYEMARAGSDGYFQFRLSGLTQLSDADIRASLTGCPDFDPEMTYIIPDVRVLVLE